MESAARLTLSLLFWGNCGRWSMEGSLIRLSMVKFRTISGKNLKTSDIWSPWNWTRSVWHLCCRQKYIEYTCYIDTYTCNEMHMHINYTFSPHMWVSPEFYIINWNETVFHRRRTTICKVSNRPYLLCNSIIHVTFLLTCCLILKKKKQFDILTGS